jgi:RES domain-containing protein
MLVYRVGKTKYANDLSGEGARLYGGRWNHKLTPCIYTSQSRALALLEYSANVNIEDLGFSLSITTIEIPNKSIKKIQLSALPKDWNKLPAPSSTKEIGTDFLNTSQKSILQIPSIIIHDEFNFILNSLHKDNSAFKIIEIKSILLDKRIKGQ